MTMPEFSPVRSPMNPIFKVLASDPPPPPVAPPPPPHADSANAPASTAAAATTVRFRLILEPPAAKRAEPAPIPSSPSASHPFVSVGNLVDLDACRHPGCRALYQNATGYSPSVIIRTPSATKGRPNKVI